MHPGLIAALALFGTAGTVYVGTQVVVPFLEQRNAQEQAAAPSDDSAPTEALGLVPSTPQTAPQTTPSDATEIAQDEDAQDDAAADEAAPNLEIAAEPEEPPARTSEAPAPDILAAVATPPVLDVVRVEPTGNVLIAGNALDAERVGLLFNDEVIAEADVTEGGDFVLMPDDTLPVGEGTLGIVVIDDDGNATIRSEEQVAVVVPDGANEAGFLVSILRPGQPVEILEREAPAPAREAEVAAVEAATPETPAVEQAQSEPAPTEPETLALEMASRIEPQASAEPVEPEATPSETIEAPQLEVAARIEPDTAAVDEPVAPVDEALVESEPAVEPFVLIDAIELEGLEVWIAGGAPPGTLIRLYQDNELLGEALSGVEGRFLYEGVLRPAEGEVLMRADALADSSAEVIARAEVPFLMPEPPQVAADVAQEPAAQVEVAATVEPETADPAPAVNQTQTAAPAASTERIAVLDTGRVIIRRGDNLWRLSRRVYGQGVRYTSIYDANRDQIRDPNLIFPGQLFDLPTPEEEWGDVPGFDALEPDQVPPGGDR